MEIKTLDNKITPGLAKFIIITAFGAVSVKALFLTGTYFYFQDSFILAASSFIAGTGIAFTILKYSIKKLTLPKEEAL